ncbi:MAG TPA: glycoside hydrolase family 127 protein [Verrucomicrobiae bacterium]|nr:glycoside hydrolase family 127 protein [Verrucomicrobiae bacterium]
MLSIRDLFLAANLAMAAAASGAGSAAQPEAAIAANYRRPFEPPTRPKFVELAPGAVEPAGWLRDWCLAARDGFTGHMDEYDEAFRQAWAADHTMTGDRLNWPKGGWPYEGGGYWFDGLARLGFALHDDALIRQAKRRLDVVVTRMNPNGILFLWWLNKNNPDDVKGSGVSNAWPMWASGLLGRALIGYYAGSGDRRVLEALEAGYGGDRDWMRLGWGMSNPWPAFDTYTWTGNKEIAAALTALFSEDGGGKNPGGASWNRYRRMPGQEGGAVENDHVVHFLESTTPWALGYLWTGRREFLDATLAWHDLLERVAMQPHGAPVADEWYGPTGAFRGTETCDVAGYVWSQAALLAVTGEGRIADRLERAFFNAGPATVSRDFRTHVYFQSPNRFADRSPDFPHGPKASGGSYRPKHSPLCCTAALNRIVPYYVTHMWMATYDNGLAATCYGPCRVTALAADRVPVEITCRTDYPFNESIEMVVRPAKEAEFPLLFHIPGWCTNPELSVNESPIDVGKGAQGFARVSRKWAAGDTVRLRFPMGVRVETGRDVTQEVPLDGAHKPTPVTIPDPTSALGAPYASVSYGPLLFALPIPDTNDPNTPDPSARWRYALDAQGSDIAVQRRPMPVKWDWPLESPLKLCASAVPFDWNPAPDAPRLPAEPVARRRAPEKITLIPYGCTKFRISMFPVTAEAWARSRD